MTQGYLNLILHAHLPFVRHPDDCDPLEEDWLYEAITETYLPLLQMFRRLENEQIPFPITLVLTPTLLNLLQDPLLQTRYTRRLEQLIELSEKEVQRLKDEPEFQQVAQMYQQSFHQAYSLFCETYQKNIIEGFRHFLNTGQIEIMTCAATHGYLPLMVEPRAIAAQIRQGILTHERLLGKRPTGIWLPECGYRPGIDKILASEGIRYSVVDTHCILYAKPRPRYGVYQPIVSPEGVAFLGRDVESSEQVWSSDEGYPGDFDYREFYRDVGYDLDYDYIRPYIHSEGIRKMTGIKYYRITGKEDNKEVYKPKWARDKAALHAGNFIFNREQQITYLKNYTKRPPLITAPYDAELFGHWWYEGPQFLEYVIKKVHYDQDTFQLITPTQYLNQFPEMQIAQPAEGSWGHEGYHEVWLNGTNSWIYPYLHQASQRMISLTDQYKEPNLLERRVLNQAARELLLAQSSDWAFIMKAGTMVDYAIRRTKNHINQFDRLVQMLHQNKIYEEQLHGMETENNLFPELNYQIYSTELSS